jgi:hypothetical protein
MDRRLILQDLLEVLLGSRNVYFQPPSGANMQYPCIVYNWDDAKTSFADDKPYVNRRRYQVTVIDADPDSPIPGIIGALSMCYFERFFTSGGLNHTVYNLYF